MAIDLSKVRGIANNNPTNLDRHDPPWNGEIRDPNDTRLSAQQKWELQSGRFCVFSADHFGLRAGTLNMMAHGRIGNNTIRKLITAWCPPGKDQDQSIVDSYIAHVSQLTGFDPDTVLDFTDWTTMFKLLVAVVTHENGGKFYDDVDFEDGLRLAGLVKPVTIKTSSTAQGGAIATGATVAGAAVTSIQDSLKQGLDSIIPFAGVHAVDLIVLGIKLLIVLCILVGIGVMLRERFKREQSDNKTSDVLTSLAKAQPEHMDPVLAGSGLA